MAHAAFDFHRTEEEASEAGASVQTSIAFSDLPHRHPVRRFAEAYQPKVDGPLLPHADDLLQDPELFEVFGWATLIEPIEIAGSVDFKVLRQGNRLAKSEGRTYRDRWMSDTVDPEFVRAMYAEVVAAAVLRKPMYSRGAVPNRARSFLYVLRGTFPVFADNQARLRLFKIEAQPYVEI